MIQKCCNKISRESLLQSFFITAVLVRAKAAAAVTFYLIFRTSQSSWDYRPSQKPYSSWRSSCEPYLCLYRWFPWTSLGLVCWGCCYGIEPLQSDPESIFPISTQIGGHSARQRQRIQVGLFSSCFFCYSFSFCKIKRYTKRVCRPIVEFPKCGTQANLRPQKRNVSRNWSYSKGFRGYFKNFSRKTHRIPKKTTPNLRQRGRGRGFPCVTRSSWKL